MPAPTKTLRTRSLRSQFWARQDVLTQFDATRDPLGHSRDGAFERAMELYIAKYQKATKTHAV